MLRNQVLIRLFLVLIIIIFYLLIFIERYTQWIYPCIHCILCLVSNFISLGPLSTLSCLTSFFMLLYLEEVLKMILSHSCAYYPDRKQGFQEMEEIK